MFQNTIYLSDLLFMVVVVKYPITTYFDNIGDILLPENTPVSQFMKHIDSRHHFIYEHTGDVTVNIKIFHWEKDNVDLFTKKLINGQFHILASRYT